MALALALNAPTLLLAIILLSPSVAGQQKKAGDRCRRDSDCDQEAGLRCTRIGEISARLCTCPKGQNFDDGKCVDEDVKPKGDNKVTTS